MKRPGKPGPLFNSYLELSFALLSFKLSLPYNSIGLIYIPFSIYGVALLIT